MGAILLLWLAAAAGAAEPPADGGLSAEARAAACAGAAEERAALTAEKAALERAIADLATGRGRKRRVSGGDVARGVAGTAASVLLPFPLGAAVNAGAGAAAKGRKGKRAAAPDGRALVERGEAIDARLASLARCGPP